MTNNVNSMSHNGKVKLTPLQISKNCKLFLLQTGQQVPRSKNNFINKLLYVPRYKVQLTSMGHTILAQRMLAGHQVEAAIFFCKQIIADVAMDPFNRCHFT